jgi:serine-type D-Ala-D-Ala endopeptidase (penicillin-binding protein 7)
MKFAIAALLFIAFSATAQVPGVLAKSYVVLDAEGHTLLEKDADVPRPIASITKLLVAEQLAPLLHPETPVTIEREDRVSRHSRLREALTLTEGQLFELALVSSSNEAIYALAHEHNADLLVASVNEAAQERGLLTISIEEPSGLSANNVASANDLARFVAIASKEEFAKVTIEDSVRLGLELFHSTNPFIGKDGWNFYVSKTGFIGAAGGCLATSFDLNGKPITVVILGSPTALTRWSDLVKLRAYLSDEPFYKGGVHAPTAHRRKSASQHY